MDTETAETAEIPEITSESIAPADSVGVQPTPEVPQAVAEEAPAPEKAATDSAVSNAGAKVAGTFSNSRAKQKNAAEAKAAATPEKTTAKSSKSSAKNNSPRTHTVRKGESLYKIAKKYGMTVKELQRINGTDGSKLKPGDKIKLK